jgi:hypothetical protein
MKFNEIMITEDDMKHIWLNWLLANKKYLPNGFTHQKLINKLNEVWNNKNLWYDLFSRHTMLDKLPWDIKERKPFIYDHAIGNFIGNISSIVLRNK